MIDIDEYIEMRKNEHRQINDGWLDVHYRKIAHLLAEVKRLRKKEADIIEYVTHLTATPDVLKTLMGSPSQIHTIVNLTMSLEHLLCILRESEEE